MHAVILLLIARCAPGSFGLFGGLERYWTFALPWISPVIFFLAFMLLYVISDTPSPVSTFLRVLSVVPDMHLHIAQSTFFLGIEHVSMFVVHPIKVRGGVIVHYYHRDLTS